MFPLMLGRLLLQATQLPPNMMMERIRLRTAHCAARSTSPHYVVNRLTVFFLDQNCLFGTTHGTVAVQGEFTDLVLCCVLCREGFGVDSSLLGGLL